MRAEGKAGSAILAEGNPRRGVAKRGRREINQPIGERGLAWRMRRSAGGKSARSAMLGEGKGEGVTSLAGSHAHFLPPPSPSGLAAILEPPPLAEVTAGGDHASNLGGA